MIIIIQSCYGWTDTILLTFFLGGLCLLGAYADSDEEDSEMSEKPVQSADANGNNSTDIDSTLADFLAVSGNSVLMQ